MKCEQHPCSQRQAPVAVPERSASASRVRKSTLVFLAALLPIAAYSIGEGGHTEWPKGAAIEVQLSLSGTVGTNSQIKVSGDLLIKNTSTAPLTIQNPHNRQVLAFLVFDPLGNPVAPAFRGKADPGFTTHTLPPQESYTQRFEGLDFVTGSAWMGYNLDPGKTYRVVAVYRPAGPLGPGFAGQETTLEIPEAEFPAEVVRASAAFKTGWPARYPKDYAVSRTLLPWIKTGMTKKEVDDLLGSPDGKSDGRWDYTLSYSMLIGVVFGADGTVTEVSSPLLSEPQKADQDGGAKGSQPIRSETNRTSSAAGSRR